MREVIVIGAGPAGMMAAGKAAARGKDVLLLEKNKKPGIKLSITGKGRCNITNKTTVKGLIDNIATNPRFLYSAFYSFSSERLIKFMNEQGLPTKVERGGRVFPVSDKAEDVVQIMISFIKDNGVDIENVGVSDISQDGNNVFRIITENNKIYKSDKVILATGGCSYPATGSSGDGYKFARKMGHTVTPIYPSLVPLKTKEKWVKDTDNLNLRNVKIKLYDEYNNEIYSDFGEMNFREEGVDGPIILSASSNIKNPVEKNYYLSIDIKPALSFEKLDKRIQRDFKKYSRKYFSNSLNDLLPVKLIPVIVGMASIPHDKTVNQITKTERKNLVSLLKNIKLSLEDYYPFSEAIITSGGIAVDEIVPSTMESKIINGLYFAGEIIDVDGYTGGFNLQIAFSTGYLAGISC